MSRLESNTRVIDEVATTDTDNNDDIDHGLRAGSARVEQRRGPRSTEAVDRVRSWAERHATIVLHTTILVILMVLMTNPSAVAGGGINSGGALSQTSQIYRVDETAPPTNPYLSDTTRALSPWFAESRDQLSHLRLPVWNRYEGNGAPQLGNAQTAVLSPFSVPIYLFGFQWGYLIAALCKILVAYLAMVALVRHLGGRPVAQAAAASAYVLGGYFIVWFYWPLAAVMAIGPLVLLAFLKTYSSSRRQVVAQAGSICLLAFTGHPETAAFLAPFVVAVVAVVAERPIATMLRSARNAMIGLAAAAIQVVPFVTYLRQSAVFAAPPDTRSVILDPSYLPSAFSPNGLGRAPGNVAVAIRFFGQPNFNELLGSYVSPVAVLLALIGGAGAVAALRRGERRMFRLRVLLSAVTILWSIVWYDFFGLGTFVADRVPASAALNRSHPVYILSVCLMCAFGVEDLARAGGALSRLLRWSIAGVTGAALVAIVATFRLYVIRHNERHWLAGAWTALAVPLVCFLAAAGCIAYLISGRTDRDPSRRRTAWLIVVTAVVVPPLYGFWGVNTVIDASWFDPQTPALNTVRSIAGPDGIVLARGTGYTQPNILSMDKVRTPFLYDAINLHGHYELMQTMSGRHESAGVFVTGNVSAMNVFGITELVMGLTDDWPFDVDSSYQTATLRPGVSCAASPSRGCVSSVDGTSSAVIDPTGSPPPKETAAFRFPSTVSLAAFDNTLAYFRIDTSYPATLSTGCANLSGVDDAIRYVQLDPARAIASPAIDNTCRTGDASAAPIGSAVGLQRVGTDNRWGGQDYTISGGNGAAGIVWVPESFYSSWHVTVDGKDAPVVRVNGAFIGVQVPPGWQSVHFSFVPRDVQIGGIVTLVTLLGLAAYWFYDRRRSLTTSGHAPSEPAEPTS